MSTQKIYPSAQTASDLPKGRYPSAPQNYIFIKVEKRWDDTVDLGDGKVLYKDTTYNPEWNVTTCGEVVSVPLSLKSGECKNIVPEVMVGDKLYFNYKALIDESNSFIYNGEIIWRVSYYEAICVIRRKLNVDTGESEQVIVPIGGHTLVEKVTKEEEVTASGLYIPVMAQKKEREEYGVIAAIGTPLKNMRETGLEPGDRVIINPKMKYKERIEGKEYYIMKQEQVWCKAKEEA